MRRKGTAHPSRGSYVQGCRCEGCCWENTKYFIAYRNRGSTSVYTEAGDKELRVTCWCERDRKMKLVSAEDIVAGKTWSCGRPGCEPMFQAELTS